ncbi:MAG: cytochrome c [Bacteroidota bacterium]
MKRILLCLGLLSVVLWACGPSEEKTTERPPITDSATKPKVDKAASLGEKVYKMNCLVCHQKNGKGNLGLYPPLAGTDWVTGDKERLIGVLLNGMQGEIEVNGETYNNVMASYATLKDEEIAAVLTYIRSNFGNEASAVTAAEVAAVRSKS